MNSDDELEMNKVTITKMDVEKVDRKKKKRKNDEDFLEFVNPCPPHIGLALKVLNGLVIFALMAVLIFYTTLIVKNFHDDQDSPSTSVSYINKAGQEPLEYPAVTICNYEFHVPLDLTYCVVMETYGYGDRATTTNQDCMNDTFYITELWNDYGIDCVSINNRVEIEPYKASRPGFQNVISVNVAPNFDKYPNDSYYQGVTLLFHARGYTPDIDDIFDSQIYAEPTRANMFSITKKVKHFIDEPAQIFWETSNSYMAIKDNDNTDVDISIYYSNLATELVKEQHSYKLTNLLGDFAGMAGTLLGIDVLKCWFTGMTLPRALRSFFRRK